MTWIIQNAMEGPLELQDIGITLTRLQIRDLDLIGRENAEMSQGVKMALQKGWVRELRKDPPKPPPGAISPEVAENLRVATERLSKVTEVAEAQSGVIHDLKQQAAGLEKKMVEQQAQTDVVLDRAQRILDEVQAFAQRDPINAKAIKAALENIIGEKLELAARRAALAAPSEPISPRELEAQNRILSMREKKLDKNFTELGKTASKSAESVQEALDAMDALGLGDDK